jgi:drug/metabolite transporter (DMT)-like permease
VELAALQGQPAGLRSRYLLGAAFAVGALICWTWYPLRNADWLRQHGDRNPRAWATAQGLATLPLALVGYLALWCWLAWRGDDFAMPLGPRPGLFAGLMITIGLCSSWVGTLCWNEASQRLPTAVAGQLIVFETLAALAYAFLLLGAPPPALTLAGIALLIAGVLWAVRIKPEHPA